MLLGFSSSLRLAGRARFFSFLLGSLFILAVTVILSAQFSGRQSPTVALDVGLSVVRLLLPLAVVLMVQEILSKEFDRRYFLNSLAYPCSRDGFFLTRFFVVVFLGQCFLLVMAVVLAFLVMFLEANVVQATPVNLGSGYVVVIMFISLDFFVLCAVAGFLAVVASTSNFVLIGVFGFMLVARSFASIIELLARNTYLVSDAESYRARVGVLGYLLPDLGALDVRGVALYGRWEFLPADWPWLMTSNMSYAVCLVALAMWALNRKRFS